MAAPALPINAEKRSALGGRRGGGRTLRDAHPIGRRPSSPSSESTAFEPAAEPAGERRQSRVSAGVERATNVPGALRSSMSRKLGARSPARSRTRSCRRPGARRRSRGNDDERREHGRRRETLERASAGTRRAPSGDWPGPGRGQGREHAQRGATPFGKQAGLAVKPTTKRRSSSETPRPRAPGPPRASRSNAACILASESTAMPTSSGGGPPTSRRTFCGGAGRAPRTLGQRRRRAPGSETRTRSVLTSITSPKCDDSGDSWPGTNARARGRRHRRRAPWRSPGFGSSCPRTRAESVPHPLGRRAGRPVPQGALSRAREAPDSDYCATRSRLNSRNFVQVTPSVDISPISYQRSATVQSTT